MGIIKSIKQKVRGEFQADEIRACQAKLRFFKRALEEPRPETTHLTGFFKSMCDGMEKLIASKRNAFWFGRDLSRILFNGTFYYQPVCDLMEKRGETLIYKNIAFVEPTTLRAKHYFADSFLEFVFPVVMAQYGFPVTDENFFTEDFYELDTRVNVRQGDIVFDCGANVGYFTAEALLHGAKVYSFEPMPHLIEPYLKTMARFNGDMKIADVALADKDGESVFEVDVFNSQFAADIDSIPRKRIRRQKEPVSAKITTIDNFVARNNVERVDFIKADIEGAERLMLAGAQETLRRFAPRLSICTYHLPDDPQVLEDLILAARPDYKVIHKRKKLYAYVEHND